MKKLFLSFAIFAAALFANAVDFGENLTYETAVKMGVVKNFAKIKWGALAVDGRGKIGGHVLARNRSGSYIRTKTTPSNPQSASQGLLRNHFTASSQAWRGLEPGNRDAWNAATGNFIGTNVFGDSKTLSGFQLFMRLNNYLRLIGETVITEPPLPSSVPAFSSLSAVVDNTLEAMTLTFAPVIAATEKVLLYATAPQSAGKNFVKSEYRVIQTLTSASASPLDVATAYVAKFGAFPTAGTKVFFKMQQVQIATGLPGAVISTSSIAEAV